MRKVTRTSTVGAAIAVAVMGSSAGARAGAVDKRLDVYWIDVEGGAATLLVTPAGETVLFDAGNPGDRDVGRILKALKDAGRTRIDHLVVTHLHGDHFGGVAELSQKVPIGTLYENGIETAPEAEQKDKLVPAYRAAKVERRVLVNPGDTIPVLQVDGAAPLKLTFLGGREEFVAPGTVTRKWGRNALCQRAEAREPDPSDNRNSINTVVEFGPFRFFDGGDTTWNTEAKLVCPTDLVGPVDVFQVNHHGLDNSNNPVLVQTLAPTVAVFNNGATKGCGPRSFATVKGTRSVKAIYQVHKNLRADAENNTADEFIANPNRDCAGQPIELSVAPDGKSYVVRVPATGHAATYKTRRR